MESPCQNDCTVPFTFSKYSLPDSGMVGSVPLPVGEIELVALHGVDIEAHAPGEEQRSDEGGGGESHARKEFELRRHAQRELPEECEDEAGERGGDEVLPAEA